MDWRNENVDNKEGKKRRDTNFERHNKNSKHIVFKATEMFYV